MAVTQLDGRAFGNMSLRPGRNFLRRYRSVLNDLNVFPRPRRWTRIEHVFDRQVGAARGAHCPRQAARRGRCGRRRRVAARSARNSGVILSQMLRGFAHSVRHRDAIDTFQLALGMREAVSAARAALTKPVEGRSSRSPVRPPTRPTGSPSARARLLPADERGAAGRQ